MSPSLISDTNKTIVIFINDFFPRCASSLTKLSERLNRPLRGIMLIDAERKASGNHRPDKEKIFEEIVVDFSDDVALRKVIKSLEDQLLLVSCDAEASQLYFKQIIPHVPYVNTPTESSLDSCTDKGKMREMLLSYDSAISPNATVVHDATSNSIESICQKLSFPLIVKPVNLDASLLVNKVANKSELREVLETSFSVLNKMYASYRMLGNRAMIAEEFVEGDLYSTDVYVDARGKVYVLPFVHFENGAQVGMGGYQVYRTETHLTLSKLDIEEGNLVAEKAIHAVGLRSSVAHIELFHTNNGWKIVELGARAGGWRQDTYNISYGIDHAFNILLIKVGLEPIMPTGLKMHSATFRIHAQSPGIVDSITGVEEALKHPCLHELRVLIKPGDKVLPSSQGGEILIDGLMYNNDFEQLNEDINVVRENIKVNITKEKHDE